VCAGVLEQAECVSRCECEGRAGCQSPAASLIFMAVPSDFQCWINEVPMKSMKTLYARILGIAFAVLFTSLSAIAAQSNQLTTGTVIERVSCRADAGQSYALFLPSRYTPQQHWPIIYCFDPGARGRVPVERFKEAAEKYGVIVAGSNNSRDGSSDVAIAVN